VASWYRKGAIMIAGAAALAVGPGGAAGGGHFLATSAGSAAPAGVAEVAGTTVTSGSLSQSVASAAHSATTRSAATAHVASPDLAGTSVASAAAAGSEGNRTGGTGSVACNDGTVTYTPTTVWPPNHKMQTVDITYTDTDNDGDSTSITVMMITDNQAASDGSGELNGSGQPTDQQGLDWAGIGNSGSGSDPSTPATTTAQVRAERSGTDQSGRIYDIKVTCMDSGEPPPSMPMTMQTVDLFVSVPHDQGAG
jgi:hypothetical protein